MAVSCTNCCVVCSRPIVVPLTFAPSRSISTLVAAAFTLTRMVSFEPLPSAAVAVMFAVPEDIPRTCPELLTVAIVLSSVLHTTRLLVAVAGVISALSVMYLPCATASPPVISIPFTRLAMLSLKLAYFPLPSAAVAVIVAAPLPITVTTPVLVSTVATRVLLVFHVTVWPAVSGTVDAWKAIVVPAGLSLMSSPTVSPVISSSAAL